MQDGDAGLGALAALAARGLLVEMPPAQRVGNVVDTLRRGGVSAAEARGLLNSAQLHAEVVALVGEGRVLDTLLVSSVLMDVLGRSYTRLLLSAGPALAAEEPGDDAAYTVDEEADEALGEQPGGEENSAEVSELLVFVRANWSSGGRRQAVADTLASALGEPDHMRVPFLKALCKFAPEPEQLVRVLQRTLRAHAEGNTQRADGSGGSKTLGGVFLQQLKALKGEGDLAEELRRVRVLPPLRPYQRELAGLALAAWGVPLPPQLLAPEEGATAAAAAGAGVLGDMRRLAGGWDRNWLFVLPTGSGKTRIFVEVARGLIASRPRGGGAVVVVLVPAVVLTTQHAAYFVRANIPHTSVRACSGDRPLGQRDWEAALQAATPAGGGHSSVFVCVADCFRNLLTPRDGGRLPPVARLSQVDLLVLDEAHHAHDNHPYAQVMRRYEPDRYPAAMPRVLGLTASPVSDTSMTMLDLRMQQLLETLDAELRGVDESDEHVAAAIAQPTKRSVHVTMRQIDSATVVQLQAFTLHTAQELEKELSAAPTQGPEALADKRLLLQALRKALEETSAPSLTSGPHWTLLDAVGNWLARGREFAKRYSLQRLELTCRLLDVLRKAAALVEDAGFEGGLTYLARKAADVCAAEEPLRAAAPGGSGAASSPDRGAAGSSSHVPPPTSQLRQLMLSAGRIAAAAAGGGAATAAAAATDGRRPLRPSAPEEPALVAALRAAAVQGPSAAEAAARAEATQLASGKAPAAPAAGNSCGDVTVWPSAIVRKALDQVLSWPGAEHVVADCFTSGELEEARTFPKFWALMAYLQEYRGRERFHGIVFVKTRQAVFHVADMMRRCRQLAFLEVLELVGHNSQTAGRSAGLVAQHERHGRGMSDREQELLLQLFRAPGRKVLIATSTVEEGLDVPTCEFVVRFNAAATGIQLAQSRGRARRRDVAEFVSILQDGTLDTHLHAKSAQEEANMRQHLRDRRDAGGWALA